MNYQNYVNRTCFRLRHAVPNLNFNVDFNGEIVIYLKNDYSRILDFVLDHNKRRTRAYYLNIVVYKKSQKLKIVHSFFKPRFVVTFLDF